MLKFYTKAQALWATRDQGVTAAEYGMILALIAAVIIASVVILGNKVLGAFDKVNAKMP
jgi:pilus assembly protein Flp/PilA